VLNCIYEEESSVQLWLGQAVSTMRWTLWRSITQEGELHSYAEFDPFSTNQPKLLTRFVEHRIADHAYPLIQKWLKAACGNGSSSQ